jgi:DNA-binding NarL/FixJ family response regulator
LLAQGASNKEIAAELQLGQKTVRNYVSRLYGKLDLRSRAEISTYLHRADLARSPGLNDWATPEIESSSNSK